MESVGVDSLGSTDITLCERRPIARERLKCDWGPRVCASEGEAVIYLMNDD